MARAESNYRKLRDDDYRKSLMEEFDKLGGVVLKKVTKESKEDIMKGIINNKPMVDYRAILKSRSTITRRDWGGQCFEYCDKEIATAKKVDDLTQEQAAVICGILKIPLTEEDTSQILKENLCPCGCGEMLRKGAKFRQGHDTRLKYKLIKEYKKTKSEAILKELRKWGWEKYLG